MFDIFSSHALPQTSKFQLNFKSYSFAMIKRYLTAKSVEMFFFLHHISHQVLLLFPLNI